MTQQVIPFDAAGHKSGTEPTHGAAGGACQTKSCAKSARPDTLSPEIHEKVKNHPCYSSEAHHYFARMHVAVAPACNIQCHYCNRKYDCSNESRPGVVSERLNPEQALRKIMAVASRMPQLSVIGIAGPGDALADWQKTFETFSLVRQALPDIRLCLSTNGLALPDHVDRIKALDIDHVTITINMIDPRIGEKIYPWIFYGHRRWTGRDASAILHQRQMEGLERLVEAGVLVKVNSVMIPGINDEHLPEVHAEVMKRGAFLHNVMPLISDPAHGTHFGLTGQRGPTPGELQRMQMTLGAGGGVMSHCRQCRADAVGMLGEDMNQEFTLDKLPEQPVADDPAARQAYRELVEHERAERSAATVEAESEIRAAAGDQHMLIAICTKGGGRVNQHFGHATEFQIYEVDRDGIRFSGVRKADNYCQGGHGEDDTLERVIAALEGVSAVLCAKIGERPKARLSAACISVTDAYPYEFIETAIGAYFRAETGIEPAARLTA